VSLHNAIPVELLEKKMGEGGGGSLIETHLTLSYYIIFIREKGM
jgi:hypothetical protein